MMRKVLFSIIMIASSLLILAQNPNGNYNPYVNAGDISPSPLWPHEAEGKGTISFNIGNSGSDPLEVFVDQYITLTITLSYGAPENADPLAAVGGSSAGLFSWRYSNGTYSATQISAIPAGSSGSINIAYKVLDNSASPGLNGFNVNISPAPYQTESNSQDDDAVSSYTYTEIRDYGDAPQSYGSAWHTLDFENFLGALVDGELEDQPSSSADADDLAGEADEDGVVFPELMQQGEIVNLAITVKGLGRLNVWIDWNGDGDFEDEGERVADNVPRFEGAENLEVEIPTDAMISRPVFARFRFTPETLTSFSGEGPGGEVEDYMIQIALSPNAPSVPDGLSAELLSNDEVSLTWNASDDEDGIDYYSVYRDGVLLDTTKYLVYVDNTPVLGALYNYAVSATDNEAYESALSSNVTIRILDLSPPTVPASLSLTLVTDSTVEISWEASVDNAGVHEYRIYRDGQEYGTSVNTNYKDLSVSLGNTYRYSVLAVDSSDNESGLSEELEVDVMDVLAPSVPTGLMAHSATGTGTHISWHPSRDNVLVTGYRLYRDGVLHMTLTDTLANDDQVAVGHTYAYTVSSFDAAGNESLQSASLNVTISSIDNLVITRLSIKPNPSDGVFILELEGAEGDYTLELIAPGGAILIQNTVNMDSYAPALSLDFQELHKGLYTIRMFNKDRIYYGKLLIAK